jgi:hypothetical protein
MFKKATRQQTKLKIGLSGPSGAGKTYSALVLASVLGKKIAVIDTENGSASLYADRFDFDTLVIRPPYTVQKFVDAVRLAEKSGFDVVVVDSISHEWQGDGSLLAKKEQLDSDPKKNQFANWAPISKEHNQFIGMILNSQVHMICTMRSKQDYVLVENDRGKQAPQKVGMSPVQRDGIEYEFTTVFDVDMQHQASVSKDRTGLFDGQRFKITADTGESFVKWYAEAKPVEPPAIAAVPDPVSPSSAAVQKPLCQKCQAELKELEIGYVCPNAAQRGDGHVKILKEKLSEYLSRQTA